MRWMYFCDTRPISPPLGLGDGSVPFVLAPVKLVHGQSEVLHVQDQGAGPLDPA